MDKAIVMNDFSNCIFTRFLLLYRSFIKSYGAVLLEGEVKMSATVLS